MQFSNAGKRAYGGATPSADQIGNINYFMNRVESWDAPILEENHANNHESTDGQTEEKSFQEPSKAEQAAAPAQMLDSQAEPKTVEGEESGILKKNQSRPNRSRLF